MYNIVNRKEKREKERGKDRDFLLLSGQKWIKSLMGSRDSRGQIKSRGFETG